MSSENWIIARKRLGIPAFERNCRCTMFGGRKRKAFAVPGTAEAGKHAMLVRMATDEMQRLDSGKPGIHANH